MPPRPLRLTPLWRLAALAAIFFMFSAAGAFPEDDAKQKLKQLEESIRAQKKKLAEAKLSETSVLGELERTNSELLSAESDLRKQRDKLRQTEREIAALKTDISAIEGRLGKRRGWLKRKLRAVHRYGGLGDTLLLISSSSDVSQLMRRAEYLRRLAGYEDKLIEGFKSDLASLEAKRVEVEGLYLGQKRQTESIKKAASTLGEKKLRKELVLASVKKERASYEKFIKEMEEASQKLMEIIRKSEETSVPAGEGFRARKGRLGWPVRGELAVPYGKQKDPRYNTTVFRNGIYITAAAGSEAKSVYGGKVVFAEWFKGYGQLVIVNHGEGYHSLYANLSEIFLNIGDIIKEGAVIGRVGESVMLNSPSLYFEVRYKGKPLDPMQWLGKR